MKIEENAGSYFEEEKVNENINNEMPYEGEGIRKENILFKMLKSETGNGTIESYSNHPLNIKNDNYISQIIRGFTGILGNLNFAIVDIILGSLGLLKDKQENPNQDERQNDEEYFGEPTIKFGRRNV